MLTNDSTENAKLTIDRVAHCIRLERRLKASPAQVFEAWTKPEHVRRWWDPAGESLAVCEIDLRPGGTFIFASWRYRLYGETPQEASVKSMTGICSLNKAHA